MAWHPTGAWTNDDPAPWPIYASLGLTVVTRARSQYPKRRLFVRSREISKPRDWYFKLSYPFEIWQAHRQHCCRSAGQISERSDNSKYKSRGFETLRDLTERRLFGYWDGAQEASNKSWAVLPEPLKIDGGKSTGDSPHSTNTISCLDFIEKIQHILHILWSLIYNGLRL